MSIRKFLVRGLAAGALASAAVLALGRDTSVFAEDTTGCVLGGPGILCYTKQIQTCRVYNFNSIGAGTSFSLGAVCAQWETVTYYYYKDPAGGFAKPGLK